MGGALNELLAREKELLSSFAALTNEQHEILSQSPADEQNLLRSLEDRRAVLEELERVFTELSQMPEAAGTRPEVVATLEQMLKMDAENLALCNGQIGEASAQARQMTQNRKVVSGYGKTLDGTAQAPGFFDKKQ